MARNRCRKGPVRKILIVAAIALAVYCLATHAKAYLDDQRTLQRYVDTHTTTAPGGTGR